MTDQSTSDSSEEQEWESAIFEGDPRAWYLEESPSYSGSKPLNPAELEAARRFVGEWLQTNSQRFTIPGTEWGRSLLGWLNVLLAHTGEYKTHQEKQEEWEAELQANQGKLWRVDLLPDEAAGVEEFAGEQLPWLRFYTDNVEWALTCSAGIYLEDTETREGSESPKMMLVKKEEMPADYAWSDPLLEAWKSQGNPRHEKELAAGALRFRGLQSGATSDQLNQLVMERTREWIATHG